MNTRLLSAQKVGGLFHNLFARNRQVEAGADDAGGCGQTFGIIRASLLRIELPEGSRWSGITERKVLCECGGMFLAHNHLIRSPGLDKVGTRDTRTAHGEVICA